MKPPRRPTKQSRQKQKSLTLLLSCLESLDIPAWYIPSRRELRVKMAGQRWPLHVKIYTSRRHYDALLAEPRERTVGVLASDLAGSDKDAAREALWAVTKAARRGRPKVMDRGEQLPPRTTGEHDMVVMRHRQLHLLPNPPARVFKEYEGTVQVCAKFFFWKNRDLCRRLGYELEDMLTFAQIWLIRFWCTSRVLGPGKEIDNRKLLYRHLRQCFAELHNNMEGPRSRNMLSDRQSISDAFGIEYVLDSDGYGAGPMDRTFKATRPLDDPRLDLDEGSLGARLAELPHRDMVRLLSGAAANASLDEDAREEAKERLSAHKAGCARCLGQEKPLYVSPTYSVPGSAGAPAVPAPASPPCA